MKQLGTEKKEYIIYFTDKNRASEFYYVGEQDFLSIHAWLNKDSEYKNQEFYDIVIDGKYIESVGRRDIRLRGKDKNSHEGLEWICGYGTRHKMKDKCRCRDKFKIADFTFLEWCQKYFDITHSYQITTDMQINFIRTNVLNK